MDVPKTETTPKQRCSTAENPKLALLLLNRNITKTYTNNDSVKNMAGVSIGIKKLPISYSIDPYVGPNLLETYYLLHSKKKKIERYEKKIRFHKHLLLSPLEYRYINT